MRKRDITVRGMNIISLRSRIKWLRSFPPGWTWVQEEVAEATRELRKREGRA